MKFGDHRVYIMMAIARKNENEHLTHNTEIVFREVLRDEKSAEQKKRKLRTLTESYDETFRLYRTVNARDTLSAYWNFRRQMNGWIAEIMNGHEEAREKIDRIDSYWKSELQRPENAADSYFLIDLDEEGWPIRDDVIAVLDSYTDVREYVETPNGWHLITEPFNYTELDVEAQLGHVDYEIKTDAMIYEPA